MQKVTLYRERLTPSLWMLVGAAAVAPMAAIVLAPIDGTVALLGGAAVGIALVALLIAASPVLVVTETELRAGRARIPVDLLGETVATRGEDARTTRGSALDPRDWHLFRGGIDPVLTIAVRDQDDPHPAWVLSTRTPERLAAAIERARATRRTPRR